MEKIITKIGYIDNERNMYNKLSTDDVIVYKENFIYFGDKKNIINYVTDSILNIISTKDEILLNVKGIYSSDIQNEISSIIDKNFCYTKEYNLDIFKKKVHDLLLIDNGKNKLEKYCILNNISFLNVNSLNISDECIRNVIRIIVDMYIKNYDIKNIDIFKLIKFVEKSLLNDVFEQKIPYEFYVFFNNHSKEVILTLYFKELFYEKGTLLMGGFNSSKKIRGKKIAKNILDAILNSGDYEKLIGYIVTKSYDTKFDNTKLFEYYKSFGLEFKGNMAGNGPYDFCIIEN